MDSNSTSNQDCYKWGISHNVKDSNASPAGNLKQLQFHIGMAGEMTDIHAKLPLHPSAYLPQEHLNSYPVKHEYFQWLLCERNLVLSTSHQMMSHRSRRICVPDTLTMQQHEVTSCAILDTKIPPFTILFLYCMHSKITLRCSFTTRKWLPIMGTYGYMYS